MELESIISDLEGVRDRLGDVIFGELRRAIEAGETKRPDLERRLTRAAHAVDRALAVLRGAPDEQ